MAAAFQRRSAAAVIVILMHCSTSLGQVTLHVVDDAPLGGDGASWSTAYRYLQDALVGADAGIEIRVAGGLYTPDRDEAGNVTSGDRNASFKLAAGLRLAGGYAGLANPGSPDERNTETYQTILSGDLSANDGEDFANNDENSYHVVTGSFSNDTATLDGFTITAGNANGFSNADRGGGMWTGDGDNEVHDCVFDRNRAVGEGGAMHNRRGTFSVDNCTFIGNTTDGDGGGIDNTDAVTTVTNCTFNENVAGSSGGGLNRVSAVANCTFTRNHAVFGGAIRGAESIINCLFAENTASGTGGALTFSSISGRAVIDGSHFHANSAGLGGGMYASDRTLLTNCLFTNNEATSGGAIYNSSSAILTNCTVMGNRAGQVGGGLRRKLGSVSLTNCIFWGNSDKGGRDESAQIDAGGFVAVNYSCIEGLTGPLGGLGNIGDDPLFIDEAGQDLHLRLASPCIDAGNNARVPEGVVTDLDGGPRFYDNPQTLDTGRGDPPVVDMGAFEFADCNKNGVPDQDDVAGGTSGDCNGNGSPDECEADCNATGIADSCDILNGTSEDCNLNDVPDECEPKQDCNTNGVQDFCDIAVGGSGDCNLNDVPDECDPDEDCNGNANQDICDLTQGTSQDCNANGVPDECDIVNGSSIDEDADGIPDECLFAPAVAASPHDFRKNRFISFNPATSARPMAIRVELADAACELTGIACATDADCKVCVGGPADGIPCSRNCGASGQCIPSGEACIDESPPVMLGWVSDPITPSAQSNAPPGIVVSRVQKEMPTPRVWAEPIVHIGDCEIAPVRSYALSTTTDGVLFSERLRVETIELPGGKNWADYVSSAAGGVFTPPNAILGVDDLSALLFFFQGRSVSDPEMVVTMLELGPEVPTLFINATDLQLWLEAFGGGTYPPPSFANQGGPANCP